MAKDFEGIEERLQKKVEKEFNEAFKKAQEDFVDKIRDLINFLTGGSTYYYIADTEFKIPYRLNGHTPALDVKVPVRFSDASDKLKETLWQKHKNEIYNKAIKDFMAEVEELRDRIDNLEHITTGG